jgi:hypothetical protein
VRKISTTIAAAALVALTAAGCGGDGTTETGGSALPVTDSPATTAPATTGPATTTGAPAPDPAPTGSAEASPVSTRCHTSELAASFTAGDAAAGNRYARLVLTNTTNRACTVFGYGGLQPLDAAGRELSITLTRNAQQGPPKLVRLAPGGTVARTIHWTVVPSGTATCPTPASATIIPPDETDPLTIPWKLGEICNGKIDGYPFGVTL